VKFNTFLPISILIVLDYANAGNKNHAGTTPPPFNHPIRKRNFVYIF